MKFKQILIALILGFGLILSLGILGPISIVRAAEFTVNEPADTDDGACEDAPGDCSLREAISAASASPGHDTITIPAGTYGLTTGALVITSNLTITGTGVVTIDGSVANDRVFDISNSAVVTISNVIITNGVSPSNENGGGIRSQSSTLTITGTTVTSNTADRDGGGVFNKDGTLTIINSTIRNNLAKGEGTPGGGVGGGIANSAESADATLTVSQSSIISNTVNGVGGGGISNGAKDSTATATISATIISGNVATATSVISTAGFGGGIRNSFFSTVDANSEAILSITNSTVKNNYAYNGGGIANGTLTTNHKTLRVDVDSSTISNNTADAQSSSNDGVGNGGGLLNQDGTMTVVNSTVSGNIAEAGSGNVSGLGGGLINTSFNLAANLWLTNTTVASNTGDTNNGDALANVNGGGGATSNFKNSILAGSSSVSCFNFGGGTLNSNGHNLATDTTCGITDGVNNDIVDANPLLGSLQNNGGDTDTHALLANSPAIDAADTAVCAAAPVNGVDQRGVARGASACSIGAYEASAAGVYLPIVLKSSS